MKPAEVDALVAKMRAAGFRRNDNASLLQLEAAGRTLLDAANELEALAARPAAPVDATLENISAVARRALSFGHQATPQTPERMIERKDDALRRIHELTGVSGSVLRAAPVGEAKRLREAIAGWNHAASRVLKGENHVVDLLLGAGDALLAAALASPAPQPAGDDGYCNHLATEACVNCLDLAPVEPPPARGSCLNRTCPKVKHLGSGYLHAEDDDTPYNVDGVRYCGRCHMAMDPPARKAQE